MGGFSHFLIVGRGQGFLKGGQRFIEWAIILFSYVTGKAIRKEYFPIYKSIVQNSDDRGLFKLIIEYYQSFSFTIF